MSSGFGKPRDCGSIIYFDPHSSVGHPTSEKWVPLEFKNGLKTDLAHNCPKKKQNGSLTAIATTETPKKSNIDNVDLSVIKMIAAALNDYITIKEKA